MSAGIARIGSDRGIVPTLNDDSRVKFGAVHGEINPEFLDEVRTNISTDFNLIKETFFF